MLSEHPLKCEHKEENHVLYGGTYSTVQYSQMMVSSVNVCDGCLIPDLLMLLKLSGFAQIFSANILASLRWIN